MRFPHGETVFRDRRAQVADPYRPGSETEGDWDPELTIALEQAWVASSTSVAPGDATRSQILTAKSLFLANPNADVQPGDRIRTGGEIDDLESGTPYKVDVIPEADTNPFTGWRPVIEIPLENVKG